VNAITLSNVSVLVETLIGQPLSFNIESRDFLKIDFDISKMSLPFGNMGRITIHNPTEGLKLPAPPALVTLRSSNKGDNLLFRGDLMEARRETFPLGDALVIVAIDGQGARNAEVNMSFSSGTTQMSALSAILNKVASALPFPAFLKNGQIAALSETFLSGRSYSNPFRRVSQDIADENNLLWFILDGAFYLVDPAKPVGNEIAIKRNDPLYKVERLESGIRIESPLNPSFNVHRRVSVDHGLPIAGTFVVGSVMHTGSNFGVSRTIALCHDLKDSVNVIKSRNSGLNGLIKSHIQEASSEFRVSMPAEVVTFDPAKQTCSAQPLLKWRGSQLPIIEDVPVSFPSGGGFAFTFPLQAGDVVLLVFSDSGYENWYKQGGISVPRPDQPHAISNAIAIPGITNSLNPIPVFQADRVSMRNKSGTVEVSVLANGEVTIKGSTLQITGDVSVTGKIAATGLITSGTVSLSTHVHANPEGGVVGPPV
jgi:hypothetical protein